MVAQAPVLALTGDAKFATYAHANFPGKVFINACESLTSYMQKKREKKTEFMTLL